MSPIKNDPVRKQRSNLKIVGRLEKLFRLYTNTALHCITHYDTCDSFLFSNKHKHAHKHIHTYVFVMFTKHAKFGNIFLGLSLTTENLSIILLVLFRFYLGLPIPKDYLTVILLFYTDFSLTDYRGFFGKALIYFGGIY